MVAPPPEGPLLSVLIATLAHRERTLLELLGVLLPQAEKSEYGVEVVALQNNGSEPLANYRDRLLRSARGKYLCFVDDDDMVSPVYVDRITEALQSDPDCVGFRQWCTGTDAYLSELSLQHAGQPWDPVMHNGELTYLREFNHAMPVRASLTREANFQGSAFQHTGEDMAYVKQVLPKLRARGCREVFLLDLLYHYRWSHTDTTQNGAQTWAYRAKYVEHPHPEVISPCFRWVS